MTRVRRSRTRALLLGGALCLPGAASAQPGVTEPPDGAAGDKVLPSAEKQAPAATVAAIAAARESSGVDPVLLTLAAEVQRTRALLEVALDAFARGEGDAEAATLGAQATQLGVLFDEAATRAGATASLDLGRLAEIEAKLGEFQAELALISNGPGTDRKTWAAALLERLRAADPPVPAADGAIPGTTIDLNEAPAAP